jgi:DNA-binding winged helix-turn-helix (wHTH) protein/tetratricopeptide (TPR) repeat protein
MEYAWDDYRLNREGALLTRGGRQVDVSRKVLDCISHLIEHRHRVVAYDDLSRAIWGHDNVSHAQLAQIVLAARRALGDDGKHQRLIRTLPGLGYRWVGVLIADDAASTSASAPTRTTVDPVAESGEERAAPATSSPDPAPPADGPLPPRAPFRVATRGRQIVWMSIAALAICVFLFALSRRTPEAPASASAQGKDPIAALRPALQAGDFERVRMGLAALPPELADSPDARILDIRLDMARGRNARAFQKIESMLAQSEAFADPALHAQLLVLKSRTIARRDATPEDRLALLGKALDRLDAAGPSAPAAIRAEVLETRGLTQMEVNRFDVALRDLASAIALYERAGDTVGAQKARSNQARVWMRQGRLLSALDAMETIAEEHRRASDFIGEMFARNTLTRIQMERLRWNDALASSDRTMQLLQAAPDAGRRYRALQLRAQALIGTGRLRLAASQLEEAEALDPEGDNGLSIPALYRLESGDPAGAMVYAVRMLEEDNERERNDILLDGDDGALLIWITAAQRQAKDGRTLPTLPANAERLLRAPRSTLARIARGRWLWSQGRLTEAEVELRAALEDARAKEQLYRMTLASEPLVAVLLQRDDPAAARTVLDALRATDPLRIDQDYRHGLLRLHIAVHVGDAGPIDGAYRRLRMLAGERPVSAEIERLFAARGQRGGSRGGTGARSGAP